LGGTSPNLHGVLHTGGDNTRNAQINLLIPGAGETRSGDNMLSPEKEPTDAASDDNMVSPENPSLQVTENAPSGDRNGGVQVTDRVAAQKNLRTCEPEEVGPHPHHTTNAARESVASNSANTADDAPPIQRAPGGALVETFAPQNQNPSRSNNPIGTAANGADGGSAAGQSRERAYLALWRAYPNQTYEGDAPDVFYKLLDEGVDPDVLIAAAAAYAKRCEGIDPVRIRLLCYWLRVRCWEDETHHLLSHRRGQTHKSGRQ